MLDKIVQTSQGLFLKYGIKSISMDDIARELGISKKTLYKEVSGKKELVLLGTKMQVKIEHNVIKEIQGQKSNALEKMLKLSRHVISFMRHMKPTLTYDLQKYHPDSWKLIETGHYDFVRSEIEKNLIDGIKEKLYRKQMDPEIIAKLYVGKMKMLVNEDEFPLRKYDKVKLLQQFLMHHLHGIVTQKGLTQLEKNEEKYVLNAN